MSNIDLYTFVLFAYLSTCITIGLKKQFFRPYKSI